MLSTPGHSGSTTCRKHAWEGQGALGSLLPLLLGCPALKTLARLPRIKALTQGNAPQEMPEFLYSLCCSLLRLHAFYSVCMPPHNTGGMQSILNIAHRLQPGARHRVLCAPEPLLLRRRIHRGAPAPRICQPPGRRSAHPHPRAACPARIADAGAPQAGCVLVHAHPEM